MKRYLAIDIGASSGRHIVGWQENGKITTCEVYRFANGADIKDGYLVWDINRLLNEVKNGIKTAFSQFENIESSSIDTWGVDYVLMDGDKELLPVYSYRDTRTEAITEEVHSVMPFSELYRRTGTQFQPFNTVYQLYCDKRSGRLDKASDFLMIPEYLMYKLTGVKSHEFINASTTGLINAQTKDYDKEIISALGLPERLFTKTSQPKTVLGDLTSEVQSQVGGNCRVILCDTHDTASAVEGIPMQGNHPYISSGTWSLLGVKTDMPITDKKSESANYSNEGGVGYNRYQKNIMGLWLVQSLRRELCPDKDFAAIAAEAEVSNYEYTFNADSCKLLSPKSMKNAIDKLLSDSGNPLPTSEADYFKSAYASLAQSYKRALAELEANTGKNYEKLYIVGGGAKNGFLNSLTEKATGKKVIALPIEATAIGNLKIQTEVTNDDKI